MPARTARRWLDLEALKYHAGGLRDVYHKQGDTQRAKEYHAIVLDAHNRLVNPENGTN